MIRTTTIASFLAASVIAGLAGAQLAIRLDPEKNLMLFEIGAIAAAEEGAQGVSLDTVLPEIVRPEKYRDLEIREGDRVLMMNGERIRDIATLRERYESLPLGAEVKLGLGRGEDRLLVKFEKVDPDEMSGGGPGGQAVVRKITLDGGDEDVELLVELHALVGERDGRLQVVTLLAESTAREGDVVTAVNGEAASSVAELRALYGAVKVGETLRIGVLRDGRGIELAATKVETPQGLVVRRER